MPRVASTMATRPTVFISSTIYDLRDLRSALKFWLEELGYKVMLSEFNDFLKKPDQNSYEACLEAIGQADYFVLIIGHRAGGWFDAAQKISITRQEYRTARKLFDAQGTPIPIVFVRQDVWDVREDRASLGRYLKDIDDISLPDGAKKRIEQHPSKFVDNADAIFSFLQEVGQIDAMRNATAGDAALPAANWIHRFGTFRDVIDGLRIALDADSHIELAVLNSNLIAELAANLTHLLTRSDSGFMPLSKWGSFTSESIKGGLNDSTTLKGKYVSWLVSFKLFAAGVPHRLGTMFVKQAVLSGAFMRYVPDGKTFVPTDLHNSLLQLMTLIDALQSFPGEDALALEEYLKKMKRYCKAGDELAIVPNVDLMLACGDVRRYERITDLTCRCLCCLLGDTNTFDGLVEWSPSPLPDETVALAKEAVSAEEAKQWASEQLSKKSR